MAILSLTSIDPSKSAVAVLALPVCEDDIRYDTQLAELVKTAKGRPEFKGGKDEELILYEPPGIRARRVMCYGLGKRQDISAERLRAFAGKATKACIKKRFKKLIIGVPSLKNPGPDDAVVIESLLEGAFLANHIFDRYKNDKKEKPLQRIALLCTRACARAHRNLPKTVETICQGTLRARNWVNTPSNDKTPALLSRSIKRAAADSGLKITVFTEAELKAKKFGALLAVAAGSANSPRLVIMEYIPPKPAQTIALIGKGVTFDSGGINIKPTSGLADMKSDMSGAAAVAATLIAVSALKPSVKVVGLLPLVENMPSGSATRPGDIVTSHNGKTVEIGNTDAEGRLIMIDAMSFALQHVKPDIMIDLATLTGACLVALGEKIAGAFSLDDALATALIESGDHTHERCWRLPLPEDYKELLKSEVADISNMSNSRWGGAVTAALFLSEFKGDTRWAHLDIAGPAFIKKGHDYCAAGGTGFGVRLLCRLIERLNR